MSVAGASGYRYTAILANNQGLPAFTSNALDNLQGLDLLEVGRSLQGDNGIGISARARQLNKQFLETTAAGFNSLFSVGLTQTSSVEALQIQINALRSQTPDSGLSRDFQRGNVVDEQI